MRRPRWTRRDHDTGPGEAPPASHPGRGGAKLESTLAAIAALPAEQVQRHGYTLQRLDYYSPVNDLAFLDANRDLWHGRGLPAGIDWNLEEQLSLLRRLARFLPELDDVPAEQPDPLAYHWHNNFWRGIDAMVHYGLMRELRPRRVVEIGCGWSSLLLARALERNQAEGATRAEVHQIEPYPRQELMATLPGHWTHEQAMLQRADPAAIEALGEGDVLFYDGSHVAKAASDVNWMVFEVLPRVASGVIIHFHDIFWPEDYPESWIFERAQTWNEQYVLQALLMFNREFELLLANAALRLERGEEMRKLLSSPNEEPGGGASVWIRRR